ncbi:S-methyl-5-thioribose-1-phosphate isomerase [Halofilum ochraceum]|uniref:S-methyl-5-thioribose-1-phosphate isomerase n=1 Tax=Halofilum ochraceum TaxID=1611323 RepID=UPI0008DAD5CE|nr:S-methyl-5-thioribose-1-phosphate isomerase [Halofilum ochraceum]
MSPDVSVDSVRAMVWHGDRLALLDQRRLPLEEAWVDCADAPAVAAAIRDMVVRGAPAIGIAAAYGVALAARTGTDLGSAVATLGQARPTAINLHWALERMSRVAAAAGPDERAARLVREAETMHAEDLAANHTLGVAGAAEIDGPTGVLTHCNTGALATGGFGTALGVIRAGWADGRIDAVFMGETRPWLQGARLTAWELAREGIDGRVIVDGAAAALMASGRIGWVVVGADRVAANGDVANKIGTCGLAVLARHYGVRFMVAAPASTIDPATADGGSIPIETRPEDEVLAWAGQRVAPPDARAWNPVFDVTPAALIDVLVTEYGVLHNPDAAALARLQEGAADAVVQ